MTHRRRHRDTEGWWGAEHVDAELTADGFATVVITFDPAKAYPLDPPSRLRTGR